MRLHNEVPVSPMVNTTFTTEEIKRSPSRTIPAFGEEAEPRSTSLHDKARKNNVHPMQKSLMSSLKKKQTLAIAESPHPSPGNSANGLDIGRIASNAAVASGSIASTFGVLSALNNIARIHPNPVVKAVGTTAHMMAGMGSAYAAQGIHEALDVKTTAAGSASFARDVATPATFVMASYAYMKSNLPKYPPKTPAGFGMTIAVSAIGSGLGGGMAEAVAQQIPESAADLTPKNHVPPTTFQLGIGRTITQIPALGLNVMIAHAATKGPIPPNLLKALPMTIGVPFAFRKFVTPTSNMPDAPPPAMRDGKVNEESITKRS